ncbi:hypothetical protein [Leptospira levettii]|uniref:hypothetical protein n=1 Tax=Leptospira levettii TaxID=2023178 RepID=UPI001083314D|nr:hypothetical protein [Leptospira levettii]
MIEFAHHLIRKAYLNLVLLKIEFPTLGCVSFKMRQLGVGGKKKIKIAEPILYSIGILFFETAQATTIHMIMKKKF